MTTHENFNEWFDRRYGKYHSEIVADATKEAWQAALSSLEVTPELVLIGFAATGEDGHATKSEIRDALTAVFAAIKEGNA